MQFASEEVFFGKVFPSSRRKSWTSLFKLHWMVVVSLPMSIQKHKKDKRKRLSSLVLP